MKSIDATEHNHNALKQDEIIVARVILDVASCHETNHYKSILVSCKVLQSKNFYVSYRSICC